MPSWPDTIPHDLRISMEEAGASGWEPPLRAWAKLHGLKLKLQWFPDLTRRMQEQDGWRWKPSVQDRWGTLKEWLEVHGIEPPPGLPVEPERPSGNLGHSTPARR